MYFLLLLAMLFSKPANPPANETEVEVVVSNIKKAKGVLVISLYNDSKAFPKVGRETLTQKVVLDDTVTHHVLIKVPAEGWYAIAMFQDELEQGKIKQDDIGVPEEPYGFSNNIRPKTSAPTFTACKFFAGSNTKTVANIRLIQPMGFKRL